MKPKCAEEWRNQRYGIGNEKGQLVWFDFLSSKSTLFCFFSISLHRSQLKIGRNYNFRFMVLSSAFVLVKPKLLIKLEMY